MRVGIVRDQRGVSLVELMIALAIAAVVIYGVNEFTVSQQESYSRQEKIQDVQQSVRAAMMLMSKEIRQAGYDPEVDCLPDANTNSVADGLSATSASSTITINTCTTTSPNWNQVVYTRNTTDNTITRQTNACTAKADTCNGTAGNAEPIADDITSLSFTYHSSSTAFTPADQNDRDNIRRVDISITATTANAEARTLTSNVGLRNLED